MPQTSHQLKALRLYNKALTVVNPRAISHTFSQSPVQLGDAQRGGGNAGVALLRLKEGSEGCCPKGTQHPVSETYMIQVKVQCFGSRHFVHLRLE